MLFGLRNIQLAGEKLAADVDQARALIDHVQCMRDCRFDARKAAAIGKRVGRNVDNAHDQRAGEREGETAAGKHIG